MTEYDDTIDQRWREGIQRRVIDLTAPTELNLGVPIMPMPEPEPKKRKILVGVAALATLAVLVFFIRAGSDGSQELDTELPAGTSTSVPGSTTEAQSDADADSTLVAEPCGELPPEFAALQVTRPIDYGGATGDIEAQLGPLPQQLGAGLYETSVLGVSFRFDNGTCTTLVDENPGVITFVPDGRLLSASEPFVMVIRPESMSSTGSGSLRETAPLSDSLGSWAATIDGLEAEDLGATIVGGLSAQTWGLSVDSAADDAFSCTGGRCLAVFKPPYIAMSWFTNYQFTGFLHADSNNQIEIHELAHPSGERLFVWVQAPAAEFEAFQEQADAWMAGWEFDQTTTALPLQAAYGVVPAGPVQLVMGVPIVLPEEGWLISFASSGLTRLVPPEEPDELSGNSIQIARVNSPGAEALSYDATVEEFRRNADLGWELDDLGPTTIAGRPAHQFTLDGSGFGLLPVEFHFSPTNDVYIIDGVSEPWLLVAAGPERSELPSLGDRLEQLITEASFAG